MLRIFQSESTLSLRCLITAATDIMLSSDEEGSEGRFLKTIKLFASAAGLAVLLLPTKSDISLFGLILVRKLSPLRRIVSRSFEPPHKGGSIFLHATDVLECGHVVYPLVTLRDLAYAYTDNPDARARRHRCRECAAMLAERKPVQSAAADVRRVA